MSVAACAAGLHTAGGLWVGAFCGGCGEAVGCAGMELVLVLSGRCVAAAIECLVISGNECRYRCMKLSDIDRFCLKTLGI